MIAFVSGTVAALAPDTAVVEVGGVGMAVQCSPNTLSTLRLAAPPKPADAADALALAICHIWRAPAQNRLQQAAARNRPQQAVAQNRLQQAAAAHASHQASKGRTA